jgi:transposase-like protein
MTPLTRPMPNGGCAHWSPTWSGRIRARRRAWLAEDVPAFCIHLNCSPRLRKRFRSSNLLERSLEDVQRRTKVIGRFPGETSYRNAWYAALARARRSG